MLMMLRLSGYTIFNCNKVRLGGQQSNIGLTIGMIRLSGYTIFNCIGVGLGGRLSNIEIDEGNASAQMVYNIQW